MEQVLLSANGLSKNFGPVQAVRNVSFQVAKGKTLGIVGESGSGKSTVARLILRLIESSSGAVELGGRDLSALGRSSLRQARRNMQMIFQDPYGSLNPRMTVRSILEEPLIVHGIGSKQDRAARVKALVADVGLPAGSLDRFPHEFSGGQRQRIAIARALATEPELIVADEPVSALDVSVQAQVLNLLIDLRERYALTMVFISHDLRVIEFLSDDVAVMYLGEVVERGPRAEIYQSPKHPYTRALLAAIPGQGDARVRLRGEVPSASAVPPGCAFQTRCPEVIPRCRSEHPKLRNVGQDHIAACHLLDGEGMDRK